jgi:hypothetical protein
MLDALRSIAFVLGYVWASPLVILMLLVLLPGWLIGQVRPLRWDGHRCWAWQVVPYSLMHKFFTGWAGFTAGWVIVYMPGEDEYLVVTYHERQHAFQARCWGVFMIPAYLLCLLVFGYQRNPFEVDARKAGSKGLLPGTVLR